MTISDRVRMHNRYILYYYYSSSTQCSTVVQVPWLPEVTEGHVTPKGGHFVCPERGFLGCVDAQHEVAQNPP